MKKPKTKTIRVEITVPVTSTVKFIHSCMPTDMREKYPVSFLKKALLATPDYYRDLGKLMKDKRNLYEVRKVLEMVYLFAQSMGLSDLISKATNHDKNQ